MVDFVAKFSSQVDEEMPLEWVLFVDGASNVKGSGFRIVLKGLGDILIEYAMKFDFTSINNQAEYEALIVGMVITLEMAASRVKAKNGLQLVTNQVFGQY